MLDVIIITAGTAIGGGLNNNLFYLLYYPSLAWFAVFFGSFRLSMVWTTVVVVAYVIVCLAVASGLDLEAKEEKELFGRTIVMYAVAASVSLLSRAERIRREGAVKRERELHRERIELSQTIHDTTAQSVFMIGIGIDTALEMTEQSRREMVSKLEATSALSKAAMWELRHPIDAGLIFEGRSLGRVLELHAASFETITSIPASVVQTGRERPLPSVTRSRLFSIAHNALTNALRHARASKVSVALDYQDKSLRMSVSDDGIGLPDDYAERGHGFKYMHANAEQMNGRLHVTSGRPGRGTTVTCEIEIDPT
ncbi:MAG: ATP-binding protein [Chloroflexota bacterium]|nr:ATP-binding protein [Chloroflexota bacterium]